MDVAGGAAEERWVQEAEGGFGLLRSHGVFCNLVCVCSKHLPTEGSHRNPFAECGGIFFAGGRGLPVESGLGIGKPEREGDTLSLSDRHLWAGGPVGRCVE